jgi:hypothetical protein
MQQAFAGAGYLGGVGGQLIGPGFDPKGTALLPSGVSLSNLQVWQFGSASAATAADTAYLSYLSQTLAPTVGNSTTTGTVVFGDTGEQLVISGKGPVRDYLVFTKGPFVVSISTLFAPGVLDGPTIAREATLLIDEPNDTNLAQRINIGVANAPK